MRSSSTSAQPGPNAIGGAAHDAGTADGRRCSNITVGSSAALVPSSNVIDGGATTGGALGSAASGRGSENQATHPGTGNGAPVPRTSRPARDAGASTHASSIEPSWPRPHHTAAPAP